MLGTYASAALICVASLLVGRALMSVSGRREWSWLEPAAGFGTLLTVSGVLARAPGHGTSATLGIVLLLIAAVVVLRRLGGDVPGALRAGRPVVVVLALIYAIPFLVEGRWGPLGVGLNNDLGLHLAWAEWLRSGFGPAPEAGYPMGPHGLAIAAAAVPGISLWQGFIGEVFAIGVLTGLTALGALRVREPNSWDGRLPELGPVRRTLAAVLVAASYLAASYFAQAAFKEPIEALFVLALAVALLDPGRLPDGYWARLRFSLPYLAFAGGIVFAYSFAGLAWPLLAGALWCLTVPEVRQRARRPGALLRLLFRPATLLTILVLAAVATLLTVVGPYAFAHGFDRVAGYNTYGPVSPVEALGIWPAANYRLEAAGGADLPGLAGAIAGLALLVGLVWWVKRREFSVPLTLGACTVLYIASLPASGDYSQAKALMIGAPLAMLIAIRPLLAEFPLPRGREWRWAWAWGALATVFVAGAAYSSFLVFREAPVGPAGHGAELKAFLPIVHGKPVLYAGQDRYAAYELLGADTHVPLVEFPDEFVNPNPEKPFDTGDAYSPIDFDSFTRATLNRSPYVITSRAAWNSEAPPDFKRVAATPSYILWKRTGPPPRDRHVLLEGTAAGALAACVAPEVRILTETPGRASLFPPTVIGAKAHWREDSELVSGESASQTLNLPAGRWLLSLQYFSPFGLTLTAPGLHQPLKAALDGQRPNTISLANDGQFWPAGEVVSHGGPVGFTISAAGASGLQSLLGYDGKAYLGELVAVRDEPRRIVPLRDACGSWLDWYEAEEAP